METNENEILNQLLKPQCESDGEETDYEDDERPKYNIVISIDDPSIFDDYLDEASQYY